MDAPDIDRHLDSKAEVVSLRDLLMRSDSPERANWQDLPASPGIYAICLPGWNIRPFRADAGRAEHAKPTEVDGLNAKRDGIMAAGSTDILYIGKAGSKSSNLRRRLRKLAHFGMGRASNHRGGEWLWQLEGIDEAEVRMWCCARGRPELLERELLGRFRKKHGDWPIANRT